jgi:hypothetical protein
MDSKTKAYYLVSKIELDKLIQALCECKDLIKQLVNINDELILLIKESSTIESTENNIDQ